MTEKTGTEKKAGSKFSGLLAAVHDREEPAPQEPYKVPVEDVQPANSVSSARRGRPRGKRSSDDFVQVTAYIGKDTHRAVKVALLGVGESREFSELVEELLAKWLQSPK